jgi:hypothetical protein
MKNVEKAPERYKKKGTFGKYTKTRGNKKRIDLSISWL